MSSLVSKAPQVCTRAALIKMKHEGADCIHHSTNTATVDTCTVEPP